MVVCGIVVGDALVELRSGETDAQAKRQYLNFLRLENRDGLEALEQAMEEVAALQRSHKITYRALERGTIGLGISNLLEISLRSLPHLPPSPAPLISTPGGSLNLLEADPQMRIELTAVDREIKELKERTRNRADHLRGLTDYLYQIIEFSFSDTEEDGFENVELKFAFGSLSKDQKLRNYYIDVIRWNGEWLAEAEDLKMRMETLDRKLSQLRAP